MKLVREGRVRAKGAAVLPAGLSFTEQAVAALRAYLVKNGIGAYGIYHVSNMDLDDLEGMLEVIDPSARWESLGALTRRGEAMTALTHEGEEAWAWPSGCLRLEAHEVVVARWYWMDVEGRGSGLRRVKLCAAKSPAHYLKLRDVVRLGRRRRVASTWQVVSGYAWSDEPGIRRDANGIEDLVLGDELRQRVARDVVRFFSEDVAKLYRDLKVPYRRGVLLHGPPGNGKTSLIRLVGQMLPEVPVMILRAAPSFDDDDLKEVIRRWRVQAPAILVIEDLNWLLKTVNVSTFLNLLDGIETDLTGGLLLVATTNHPEQLDGAINNRPGRFDVVIEVKSPGRELRAEFLRKKLNGLCEETIAKATAGTEELSFAHLQEVLRLSGLFALEGERAARSEEDVMRAVKVVREGFEDGVRGFERKPEAPFGLARGVRGSR
jgi:hypothetical protein